MDIDAPAAFLVVDVDGKMASYTGLAALLLVYATFQQDPCAKQSRNTGRSSPGL